jgi:hypothetical protein
MKAKELIKILEKAPDADMWLYGGYDYGEDEMTIHNLDYEKSKNKIWIDVPGYTLIQPEVLGLMKEGDE